jgi:cytochrome o ubiquinol oxidase subunit 1
LPNVTEKDAFWNRKQRVRAKQSQPGKWGKYTPIETPTNSATGFINAFFAVIIGFAMIWHIWWLAAVGMLGALLTILAFAFREREEIEIPAEEIARFDRAHPVEFSL